MPIQNLFYSSGRYTPVPQDKAMCPTCRGLFGFTAGVSKHASRMKPRPSVVYAHKVSGTKCEGSRQPVVPWLKATGLPEWEELHGLDKDAVRQYMDKCRSEGGVYARHNYPCEYVMNPILMGLSRDQRCRHAWAVWS